MKLAYPIATPEVAKSAMSFCGDFKQNIADIKAVGYSALELIVMTPLSAPDKRVVLKSGNFGQADFFERTLSMTGEI